MKTFKSAVDIYSLRKINQVVFYTSAAVISQVPSLTNQ